MTEFTTMIAASHGPQSPPRSIADWKIRTCPRTPPVGGGIPASEIMNTVMLTLQDRATFTRPEKSEINTGWR